MRPVFLTDLAIAEAVDRTTTRHAADEEAAQVKGGPHYYTPTDWYSPAYGSLDASGRR